MINYILLILGVVLAIILLQVTLLYFLNKLFKIQNISWLKSLLIIFSLFIGGGVISIILGLFLPVLIVQIATAILSYFIFDYFIKKSGNLISVGKKIFLFITFLVLSIVLSVVVALSFRLNIAEPFTVAGDSMAPTYLKGDYLILSKIHGAYKRGDIVVYTTDTAKGKTYIIQRIIGLSNETVSINGDIVTIKNNENPNGFVLTEPYIKLDSLSKPRPAITATMKGNEYFLLGDNRPISADSRVFGPIKSENIVGLIEYKVFNLGQ